MDPLSTTLLEWFKSYNGKIDEEHMGLAQIPGCGIGAIALKDVPTDHVLFEIPRNLLLSTRTCELKRRLGKDEWARLGKGWTPLICCMMWEAAKGRESIWEGYLNTMPVTFDTPMFWPETDIEELQGTTIAEKIGREEAEKEYIERLLPLIQTRPDLFKPEHLDIYYTLSQFHIMGSRILSRSFHVEQWAGDGGEDQGEPNGSENPDVSMESRKSMDVDPPREENPAQTPQDLEDQGNKEEGGESDSDDEDEENVEDVAMVPMADMLNARYGGENAKLFYEPTVLKMISTKPIPAGEQIWNTYGDPPNSDLLRRYGYVDTLGSGLDIVEIKGSTIVECAASSLSEQERTERVDWWLEMGGDDTFTLDTTTLLPPALLSFAQLMLLSDTEWKRVQEKEKPPKPKSQEVHTCVREALNKRLAQYPTPLQEDEAELNAGSSTLNKRHALTIRIGEKRVLQAALASISDAGPKKRKAESEGGARKKGARQR
ncbi:SET domain-containing protein [Ceratobasidium sp. AG-I]|nr:SET domain-containing protein [Ceratobasidium sp. AG-I]